MKNICTIVQATVYLLPYIENIYSPFANLARSADACEIELNETPYT